MIIFDFNALFIITLIIYFIKNYYNLTIFKQNKKIQLLILMKKVQINKIFERVVDRRKLLIEGIIEVESYMDILKNQNPN